MEWQRARITATTLQCPKLGGGLALPNLKCYHWAFQVRAYVHGQTRILKFPGLPDLLYVKQKRNIKARLGSIISYSLLIWHKVEKLFGDIPRYHKLSPLWNNTEILMQVSTSNSLHGHLGELTP